MNQINQYTIINKIFTFNEKINWWLVESEDGTSSEMLTIQQDERTEKLMKRLIQGELKPLVNKEWEGIQTIKEVSFSSEEQCYVIVYEILEGYDFLSKCSVHVTSISLLSIAKGLKQLKDENRSNYVINTQTIRLNKKGESKLCLIGLFDLFKSENLLDATVLAPNVHAWLENRKEHPKPNFQDDIYALVKSFENVLEEQLQNTAANRLLEKALKTQRIERYTKYHELISDLEKLPIQQSQREEQHAVKVETTSKHEETLPLLLKDMNVKTYLKLDTSRSDKDNQITGQFSTASWSGKFVVDTRNHLFIPYFNEKSDEKLRTSKRSFVEDFYFDTCSSNYKIAAFFEKKFEEINQLANLSNKKVDLIRQWKTLPDKEREYIEEQAFKEKYTQVEVSSDGDKIVFYLKETTHKTWTAVKKLKTEKTILFIDDQKIGTILNYDPNKKIITIADPYCSIDEIQPKGELIEDVSQETSQFKKQVEACDRFKEADVANPVICDILATPEKTAMPYCPLLGEKDYEDFEELVLNPDLKNDTTQREAVLEALSYKPVYLIQGPPGTGKTTVIVELIQQILHKQSDAKILVTSQSNLAVDNVLEKIATINESKGQEALLFMRLASDYSINNIKEKIQSHTFSEKLKKWVTTTTQKSEENLLARFPKVRKKKEWVTLYDFFIHHTWDDFIRHLNMRPQYLKNRFQKTNTPQEALKLFEQELGKAFINLKHIHKDWIAFLAGVTVEQGDNKKRSMLNDGSAEIDFLTAMMREINIIGATCIHIASSKYSNINFRFDYVLMDESSKASPPETLVPINMGKNIVLIGDHKQLPPVVTREDAVKKKVKKELEDNGLDFNKDFGISLFEQLVTAFEQDESKQQFIKMLDIQYRMPKQVGTLISKYFYNGKLNNPKPSILPDYDANKHHGLDLKVDSSILFISTSNEEFPYDNDDKFKRSNSCNVKKIQAILDDLNTLYPDNLQKTNPFTIGIIAGYRGQVELLKQKIDKSKYTNFVSKKEEQEGTTQTEHLITINTVDKFQGAEQDIIIYDVVRSSRGKSVIGFLDDYRRINVAFSRVKKLLLVVGDVEYLTKRATLHPKSQFKEFKLQQIAQELKDNGFVFDHLKEAIR